MAVPQLFASLSQLPLLQMPMGMELSGKHIQPHNRHRMGGAGCLLGLVFLHVLFIPKQDAR